MARRWSLLNQGARLVRGLTGFGANERVMLGPIFSLSNKLSSDSNTKTPELLPPPPVRYFTPRSTEGTELDPKKGITLQDLFDKKPWLCFDNYRSTCDHDFSNLSKGIFVQILTISYQQGDQKSRHFHFDPSEILAKHMGRVVLEVAVPVSQLQDSDLEVKSIFKDQVVGPFAGMILSFCLEQAALDPKPGGKRKDQCYKEVYDLLFQAKQGKWWSSLDELLSHPLLWISEQKMTYLNCMLTWMETSKPGLSHGIADIPDRARSKNLDFSVFRIAFSKKIFFYVDYNFTIDDSGEVNVTEIIGDSSKNKCSWKDVLINQNCFGKSYKFGVGTQEHEFYDMVKLCRHIIIHFEDQNFTAYVLTLDSPTSQVAMIHLDRKFSLSLGIFYALKDVGVDVKNITAFSPSM